jgi:hypothetical protein
MWLKVKLNIAIKNTGYILQRFSEIALKAITFAPRKKIKRCYLPTMYRFRMASVFYSMK